MSAGVRSSSEGHPMSTVHCPECGQPATIVDRFRLRSTDGPVEHLRTRCTIGHVVTPQAKHVRAIPITAPFTPGPTMAALRRW